MSTAAAARQRRVERRVADAENLLDLAPGLARATKHDRLVAQFLKI
jgi:hypothetical protein